MYVCVCVWTCTYTSRMWTCGQPVREMIGRSHHSLPAPLGVSSCLQLGRVNPEEERSIGHQLLRGTRRSYFIVLSPKKYIFSYTALINHTPDLSWTLFLMNEIRNNRKVAHMPVGEFHIFTLRSYSSLAFTWKLLDIKFS